jgi:hypothetical protein
MQVLFHAQKRGLKTIEKSARYRSPRGLCTGCPPFLHDVVHSANVSALRAAMRRAIARFFGSGGAERG